MTSPNQRLSSTSVRIRYPKDVAPTTLQSATAALAEFGEIARLDVSLSALNGFVLVTYYDVRSAQLALAAHAQYAETFPGASHDFRRVRIIPSALQEAVSRLGGFHTFGEIASVSRSGDHIELEFFDLRCAHKVIFSVTGSEPVRCTDTAQPQQVQEPASVDLAAAQRQTLARIDHLCGLMVAKAAAQNSSQGEQNAIAQGAFPDPSGPAAGVEAPRHFTQHLARALYPQQPVASNTAGLRTGSLGFPLAPGLAPSIAATAPAQIPLSVAPSMSGDLSRGLPRAAPGLGAPAAVLTSSGVALQKPAQVLPIQSKKKKGVKMESSDDAAGKPAREKVKEHLAFDINPHQIKNGDDKRTTVMVRNIPKTCSREDFVQFLARSRLSDKYNFLYMPFDKRRNMRCGFAFVNLVSPEHVLRLFGSLQAGAWQEMMGAQSGAAPAVSYARLQGIVELTQHFSTSAVMCDNSRRERPVFVTSGGETSEPGSDEYPNSQPSSAESQSNRGHLQVYAEENSEGSMRAGLVGA